ncbi:flagellar motor switch protein FliM [Anaeromicrobium sediminis]|uniref:Flagellar motor switch protein FliM n=1 Tax=Anaeromicrobium sediminis TaxID=1478221 RepID=A0A267MNS8_9FIRM|nr:flagellar motor switch protein FliM [Anaeromicrobium sediminis]PAB61261.1 flagellar motor switch protein FliM [Anaeromicrobium sediminis]
MSDVLSQSEIDQLLQALSTGEVDAQEIKEEINEVKIKDYDFRRPDKFPKDQIRTLHIIHENYARLLKNFLSGYLRSLVSVEVISVEQLSNYEFTNSISNPTILGIVDFSPLEGQIIMDIGPDIAFSFVDRLLGGNGDLFEEKRGFTEIELSLLKKIVREMAKLLKDPWENVIELRPKIEKIETNSQFAQIVSPNETIALVTLNIKIGEIEGMINICIPHILVEPILPKLNTKFWFNTKTKESTKEDEEIIEKRIEKSNIIVKAILGTSSITVRDFLELQIGDVIPIDATIKQDAKVYVGKNLKYTGKIGTKGNKMAIRIENVLTKGDE